MVIGRSDKQQSPSHSMAFTTPRECLALLGRTYLGQQSCAAQTGRTHDRNRTETRNFPLEPSCTYGAVHIRVRVSFRRRSTFTVPISVTAVVKAVSSTALSRTKRVLVRHLKSRYGFIMPSEMPWTSAFKRGIAAYGAGDLPAALKLCRLAAEGADDPGPARLLAVLLADAGQTKDALTWARRAIALGLTSAPSHAALGRVLVLDGQPVQAERAFRAALAIDPSLNAACQGLTALGEMRHRAGLALFQAKQWAQAAQALTEAARLLPRRADILHDMGTAHHEAGDLAAAQASYEAALRYGPARAETWHNLGSLRQALHDIGGALAAYGNAFRLRPDFFPRIAQELAAGPLGRVWLRAADLRATLAHTGGAAGHDESGREWNKGG